MNELVGRKMYEPVEGMMDMLVEGIVDESLEGMRVKLVEGIVDESVEGMMVTLVEEEMSRLMAKLLKCVTLTPQD